MRILKEKERPLPQGTTHCGEVTVILQDDSLTIIDRGLGKSLVDQQITDIVLWHRTRYQGRLPLDIIQHLYGFALIQQYQELYTA